MNDLRYRSLDSLRGVCASMVVLMHFKTTGWISLNPTVKFGYLFVDFFFVLSGFVIAASYGDKLAKGFSVGKFIALRFGRLYPLHVVMLAAFLVTHVALIWLAPGLAHGQEAPDSYSTESFFASLTMTQPFFGRDTTFWNAPAWSIAAEFWTYVIFAFLFRSAKRWVVPFALCASLLSAGLLFEYSPEKYHFLDDYHDGALFRAVLGFGLGVAVFHVHRAARDSRPHPHLDCRRSGGSRARRDFSRDCRGHGARAACPGDLLHRGFRLLVRKGCS